MDSLEQKVKILGGFPKLRRSVFEITSDSTDEYNCIAFAAGDVLNLWWPDNGNIGYWPSDAPREVTLVAFLKMFGGLGYELCEDGTYENGFEKVAIFTKDGTPTHAARSDGSRFWKSKLGRGEDIQHFLEDVGGVDGSGYGEVAAFMRRSVNSKAGGS